MLDTIIHRWLRVPYTLHVRYHKKAKKSRASVLFVHGIGNTGEGWQEVIDQLPRDISIMTIDLLGFGDSPRPEWAKYSVKTQARSIIATLIKLRLTKKIIIVGHSLGSLVAIEVAKSYPLLVESLVLCSPPLYDSQNDKNYLLRRLFRVASNRPDDFVRLSGVAAKYNLINPTFNVTHDNFHSYMATLRASILTQTSLQDVKKINLPIYIIAGKADPWIKKRNLNQVIDENSHASLTMIMARHEIRKRYAKTISQIIEQISKHHKPTVK